MPVKLTIYTKEDLRPTVCEEVGNQGLAFLVGSDNTKGTFTYRVLEPKREDFTQLARLKHQQLYFGLTQGAIVHVRNLAQRGSQARISYEEFADVLNRELLNKL